MNDSPRSTPGWLKWAPGILGACLVPGAIAFLALRGAALWAAFKAYYVAGFHLTDQVSGPALGWAIGQAVAALTAILLGTWLVQWTWNKRAAPVAAPSMPADTAPAAAPKPARRATSASARRWSLCNVFDPGPDSRRIWQFDAGSRDFRLNREHSLPAGQPLPVNLVGKSWSALWQPKLNVALLPPDNVFIRVAQFPQSSPEEIRAMVELQLEKLSPIPVTQAVWTMHPLPAVPGRSHLDSPAKEPMQTVVVTIVARSVVEEFLGRLEGQGYLADRLELPMLDQLQATAVDTDGAWIYPVTAAGNTVLVAWWYLGVLQNLDVLTVPAGPERATALKDQLMQMAWAGELEGWLTAPPVWHLVAEAAMAQDWEPALRQGLDQPIEIVAPVPEPELAALTARRSSQADPQMNLLPAEFASRYQQKFVDRLWLHGLVAVLGLYVVGCIIYFIAVWFVGFQAAGVEKQVAALGPTYTNVLQLRARYGVLKERQELKYAALDCWEATAELMPEGLTLESLNFSDGKKLTLSGTVPAQQIISANDFSGKLRKYVKNQQPMFGDEGDAFAAHVGGAGGGTMANWSFGLELKRGEKP